jgi:hypothetical protein
MGLCRTFASVRCSCAGVAGAGETALRVRRSVGASSANSKSRTRLENRLTRVVLIQGLVASKAVVADRARGDENARRTRESPAQIHQGSRCGDATIDEFPATGSSPWETQNRRSREVDYGIDTVVRIQLRRCSDDAYLRAETIEGPIGITGQYDNPIATCSWGAWKKSRRSPSV